MQATENERESSFALPERTIAQLDELVRIGRFSSHEAAITVAVERLAEEYRSLAARQKALARVSGALRLGSTRESLQSAEHDRLDWESGHR